MPVIRKKCIRCGGGVVVRGWGVGAKSEDIASNPAKVASVCNEYSVNSNWITDYAHTCCSSLNMLRQTECRRQ